jgi:glycosyltransferase involved in cell wall biosynthesis
MKVLIDFTQIPTKKVGVGTYAMSLILELSKIETNTVFYVLVLRDDNEMLEFLNSSPEKIKTILINKTFRKLAFRFLLEQFYIPFLIIKYKICTLHSLHYSFPLLPMPVKKVVTLHDMTFFIYPEFHRRFQVFYFKFFIRLSLKCCDKIICVSNSTKRDVISLLNLKKDFIKKLNVTSLGTNYQSDYIANIQSIEKYGLKSKGYFLFIGTLEPRKNINSIIEAYYLLYKNKAVTMDLVIVGKKGWHYDEIFTKVKKLNLGTKVIFTGFIEEEEKKDLLWHAYSFIYPSYYEGFGIPVLEAMAFGIPSVTSNLSSLPEVAGDASILINPKNINEIFDAMALLINEKAVYEDLIKKSLNQAKKFTWRQMAIETLTIYNEK